MEDEADALVVLHSAVAVAAVTVAAIEIEMFRECRLEFLRLCAMPALLAEGLACAAAAAMMMLARLV